MPALGKIFLSAQNGSTLTAVKRLETVHSLRNSVSKRLYTWRLKSDECARVWTGQYWQERDGERVISCISCPKFLAEEVECSIPFSSPIRKCVSAAQEANLHSLSEKTLLEIGFGKHSIPRKLVEDAGGTWTGIDPMLPTSKQATVGGRGFGKVANIPFPDCTFDVVAGIQSIEHWYEPWADARLETGYAASLQEVYRVLKPDGSIYFCAPIHLHGHEMFIVGDVQRIRRLFDPLPWKNITIERWREDYSPLERYRTPDRDVKLWERSVTSYPRELLEDILENRSVSLITIKAEK